MNRSLLDPAQPLGEFDHLERLLDAAPLLMNQRNTDRYAAELASGIEAVVQTFASTNAPFTGRTPADVSVAIDHVDLDSPLHSTRDALTELQEVYLRDAVYFHHPRYAAHLNCPVVIPALLGETILTAVNSSLDTWDQSAGATLIERALITWTADRLGLGPDADGVFTSGGSQSNLQALLMARSHAGATSNTPTTAAATAPHSTLRIFASDAAHFSVQKSARLLGLGEEAVVVVPADADRRMRPGALAAALEAAVRDGLTPMAVVATAGTTDFGSIDPLSEIAELCGRYRTWMHVDAAYGGGLITSLRHRNRLAGIEHADSVTVDYHKTFFQPVSSSAVLVKDARMLGHVTHYADYLNPRGEVLPNQVNKSLQTTRRFDALKLWLTLRIMGADGIGTMLDEVIALATQFGAEIDATEDFELAAPPQLSTLVFRYTPKTKLTVTQDAIRKAIFASGEAVVAGTVVDGDQFLKFTLLNPDTSARDLRAILDLIRRTAANLEGSRA
ncbi:lysine decarboxylase DesA [Arthrobacter tecti]